MFRPW